MTNSFPSLKSFWNNDRINMGDACVKNIFFFQKISGLSKSGNCKSKFISNWYDFLSIYKLQQQPSVAEGDKKEMMKGFIPVPHTSISNTVAV